jgi:hypothetical protein
MTENDERALFAPTDFWRVLIVAVILILGLGTRFYDLKDPPLDYAAARQLRSAMIARGKYYAGSVDAQEWQRETARKQQNIHGMIEPEIIERITVFTYRLVGGICLDCQNLLLNILDPWWFITISLNQRDGIY